MGFITLGKSVSKLTQIIILYTLVNACIESDDYNIEQVTATPSFVLPIAFGNLMIEDLLSEDDSRYIQIDDEDMVSLVYEETLHSRAIHDALQLEDRTFEKRLAIGPGVFPPSANEATFQTLNSTLNFNYDPEQLSKIIFKQGKLVINVSVSPATPANFSYDVAVKIPQLTLADIPFNERLNGTKTFDLNGYNILFADNDATPINITVYKKGHASSVTILPNTEVVVTLSFLNLDFSYADGFFGDQFADVEPEIIVVNPFKPVNEGTVSFADPKLSFEVINQYGVPVHVNFTTIEARKNASPPLPIKLDKSLPLALAYPTEPDDSVVSIVNVLNAEELLDFNPQIFYYKMDIRTNPNLTSGFNFAEDQSEIRVRFKAIVPLYGKASDIILSDTSDFNIDDIEESEIESLAIKASVINEFPLDGTLQLYFTDANFNPIDSLFTTQQTSIIKSSVVDQQGELTTPGTYQNDISIDKNKINKILKAEKLIIVSRMSTTKNADGTQLNVKFKASYSMKTRFGLRVDLKVKADL